MTNEERDALLQTMAGQINTLVTEAAVSNEKVKRHDKSLYGNGSPGLMTRVQKIEDCHDNEGKGVAKFIAWVGAITSIVAVGVAIIALLK